MENKEVKNLCLEIINADHADNVFEILKKYNLWDDENIWRPYGDTEGNWSTINAHGANDYCLNEKIINSIDSMLMASAWSNSIDPESDEAPKSVSEAVSKFFGDPEVDDDDKKSHIFWSQKHRLKISKNIVVSCGGDKKDPPTIAIADLGEGQVPEMVPETFLSLQKSNKIKINFVQGKWNQGGSAAMKHCGKDLDYKIQFIVTKRNPEIIKNFPNHPSNDTPRKNHWSFTVVKRVEPKAGAKRSEALYLAPIGASQNPRKGEVLSFEEEDGIPFFPKEFKQCHDKAKYGSLTKLFNYNSKTGDAMRTGGLIYNLGWLLPRCPVPFRFHDARKGFSRKAGSFSYNVEGVANFLDRTSLNEKGSNIEKLEPATDFIRVDNYQFEYDVYVFQKDKGKMFKGNCGLIWTINGQAHATQPDTIFTSDELGYSTIASDLLVILKCDDLNLTDKEDVFASTRDKIDHNHHLVREIKKRLMKQLKEHTGIQDIVRQRIVSQQDKPPVQDQRILKQLQEVISETPLINDLDLGDLLKNTKKVEKQIGDLKKNLKEFPDFFKFMGLKEGDKIYKRDAFIKSDVRLNLITNAKNNYFTRRKDKGNFELYWKDEQELNPIENFGGPFLKDGLCKINIKLRDDVKPGDLQKIKFIFKDKKKTHECDAELNIREKSKVENGNSGKNRNKNKNKNKNKKGVQLEDEEKHDLIIAQGLDKNGWEEKFGEDSWNELEVLKVNSYTENEKTKYLFYYNKEYKHLLYELNKATAINPKELIERRFQIALSLFGMSTLSTIKFDKKNNRKGKYKVINPYADSDAADEQKKIDINETQIVEIASRTVAMLILPTLKILNQLSPKNARTSSLDSDDA